MKALPKGGAAASTVISKVRDWDLLGWGARGVLPETVSCALPDLKSSSGRLWWVVCSLLKLSFVRITTANLESTKRVLEVTECPAVFCCQPSRHAALLDSVRSLLISHVQAQLTFPNSGTRTLYQHIISVAWVGCDLQLLLLMVLF